MTGDYHRRYRLVFETTDFLGESGTSLDCEACTEPFFLSLDLTFERGADDFDLVEDGFCLTE